MAGKKRVHRTIIASVALLGVLGSACGGGAGAGGTDLVAPARPHVIQDPDNPAARNYMPSPASGASVAGRAWIVRDPENPYWSGYRYIPEEPADTAPSVVPTAGADAVGSRAWIVRDPDNPYWKGR